MAASSEQILQNVFELLALATFASPIGPAGSTTWVETGRRLKLWNDVAPQNQPAMFLADHDAVMVQQGRGIPGKLEINPAVFCYARSDGGLVGSTIVSTMFDAVVASLAPNDRTANVQNLNGTVYRCWVEGRVLKDPGDIDNQALLVVPLRIIVP